MTPAGGREIVVSEWIARAADDEKNLDSILKHRDGTPAQVCFLAQQMAEKLLKALLIATVGKLPKTHDLRQLMDLVAPEVPAVERVRASALLLTPYYVGARYPGGLPLEFFTWTLAEEASRAATVIRDVVLRHLGSKKKKGNRTSHI